MTEDRHHPYRSLQPFTERRGHEHGDITHVLAHGVPTASCDSGLNAALVKAVLEDEK